MPRPEDTEDLSSGGSGGWVATHRVLARRAFRARGMNTGPTIEILVHSAGYLNRHKTVE